MAFANMLTANYPTLFDPASLLAFIGAQTEMQEQLGPLKRKERLLTGDTFVQVAGMDMAPVHNELANVQVSRAEETYSAAVTMVEYALGFRMPKSLWRSAANQGVIARQAASWLANQVPSLLSSLIWRREYEAGRFMSRLLTDAGPDSVVFGANNHPSAAGVGVRDNLSAVGAPSYANIMDDILALRQRIDYTGKPMKFSGPVLVFCHENYAHIFEQFALPGVQLSYFGATGGPANPATSANAYTSFSGDNRLAPRIAGISSMSGALMTWDGYIIMDPAFQLYWCEQWGIEVEEMQNEVAQLGRLVVADTRFDIVGSAWEHMQFRPAT